MILHEDLQAYNLILASQSPRRKMLLEGLDIHFDIVVRENIDESFPNGLGRVEIAEYLAASKSDQYADLLSPGTILITADTIVWHRNEVVGKPRDRNDAIAMLERLSGDTHIVVTGVCLRTLNSRKVFSASSEVVFRKLTGEEIRYYADKYQPFDKAGSYGIQEWIGYIGIERIDGSFYNVMGLPVQQVYTELSHLIAEIQS